MKIIICSEKLVRKINNGKIPKWTWERWPDGSLFFYSYDICKRVGSSILRHEILNFDPMDKVIELNEPGNKKDI